MGILEATVLPHHSVHVVSDDFWISVIGVPCIHVDSSGFHCWCPCRLSTAMFLVRTMKRVMFAETRHYERDSARHRYLLLLLAACQFPLAMWLGKL